MTTIGINGLGRIGRLVLRNELSRSDGAHPLSITRLNDPASPPAIAAHLLEFDSIHGRWTYPLEATPKRLRLGEHDIACSTEVQISETDWSGCELVIDASGKHKTVQSLRPYFDQGVKKVLVCAPVKEQGALNVVVGVNHALYDPSQHDIVTAASCTTNCIAPAIKVIHEQLGIRHGSITTVHNITNTQSILDTPHSDLRRARASADSLIPTTTGSATAIAEIFPELRGRLNGHAIRVPVANASLTDCVFELETATDAEQVNQLLRDASSSALTGILGVEDRPLVSIDYRSDPRSSIVDALSTMVVNHTQLKLYLWYDNEWGYANRVVDLMRLMIQKGI